MTTHLIPVDFHSDRVLLIERDGEPFVAMKPICEALGLDWRSQQRKLTSGDRPWGCEHMTIPSPGGDQEMVCLPLRKLPAWLFSISPAKVKPALRVKLVAYQNECDEVLWAHFMGERKAQQAELALLRACNQRQRAHILADRPYWNKIARYWDLGMDVATIAKLLRRPHAEVVAHHEEMKRSGVIASKIRETGVWVDSSGVIPGHAQDGNDLAIEWSQLRPAVAEREGGQ